MRRHKKLHENHVCCCLKVVCATGAMFSCVRWRRRGESAMLRINRTCAVNVLSESLGAQLSWDTGVWNGKRELGNNDVALAF